MIDSNDRVSLLQKVSLFQGIERPILYLIAQKMKEASFDAGEVVFSEGEPGDHLYVVLTGTMHVFAEKEGTVVTYDRLGEGESFGEMALIDDAPRSASVEADSLSSCVTLSKRDFLNILNNQPDIALSMVKSTFGRLRSANVQVQEYASQLGKTSEVIGKVDFT